MNVVGPFPPTFGQKIFLVVVVDYFTKWIEAEPLTWIISQQIKSFAWKFICRFRLQYVVLTYNGKQFTDKFFR